MANNADPDQMAFKDRLYPGSAGLGLKLSEPRTFKHMYQTKTQSKMQTDQSSVSAWRKLAPLGVKKVSSENSYQTVNMQAELNLCWAHVSERIFFWHYSSFNKCCYCMAVWIHRVITLYDSKLSTIHVHFGLIMFKFSYLITHIFFFLVLLDLHWLPFVQQYFKHVVG